MALDRGRSGALPPLRWRAFTPGIFLDRSRELLRLMAKSDHAVQAGTPMAVTGVDPRHPRRLPGVGVSNVYFCPEISPPEADAPRQGGGRYG